MTDDYPTGWRQPVPGPDPEKPDQPAPDAPVTDEDGRPIQPQDAPRRDDDQPEPSVTGTLEEREPTVNPII